MGRTHAAADKSDVASMPVSRVRDAAAAARMLAEGQTWPTMAADLRRMVPRWHFEMLADDERNEALETAIVETVRPGQLVLDLGTGAGLTAMLAARAGATVVSCEENPVVAELARQVVAANGLQQSVTVLAKRGSDLQLGEDLPRRADVLVAEVLDADLFGEHALTSIDDARRRLLADGAAMLPSKATVWAQLVESRHLRALNEVGTVEGFDLSAFNAAATAGVMYAKLRDVEWWQRSNPTPLFEIDFAAPCCSASGTAKLTARHPGAVDAVVVWFHAQVGRYWLKNIPDSQSHWKQAVYLLPRFWVRPDEVTDVVWVHDMRRLEIALAAPPG